MARTDEASVREALLRRLAALLGLRSRHLAAEQQLLSAREPDPGDLAAVQSGADSLERLSEAELRELQSIHGALRRLEAGSYGVCDDCGEEIDGRRLEALPWASRCVDCEGVVEAQGSRRPAGS